MANSPDLAPMDYDINANFKRILKMCRAENIKQLARIIPRELNKIDVRTCRNALSGWKYRVETMIERQGNNVEIFKKIK